MTKFVLVGPYAGQTRKFGPKSPKMMTQNFHFIEGVYEFNGDEADTIRIGKYLRKCYQAYPEGPELEAAQAAWDEKMLDINPEKKSTSLRDVIASLDSKNNEHWNKNNDPDVDAVSKLAGRKVTRAEIKEAAPNINRDDRD